MIPNENASQRLAGLGPKKINIIMFNMSSYAEWEKGVSNRNWHIFKTLLNDERVGKILAVDYLPHTWRRAVKNYKENIIQGNAKRKIIAKNLTSRTYKIDEKLYIHSSITNKFSLNKFYAELNSVIKKAGLEDYVIWSCYPLETGYFKVLKPKLKVFDAVDDWSKHPSYRHFADSLKQNYKTIGNQADLIFTVTEELKNLFTNQENIFLIPNAVDLKNYQREFPIVNRDIGELPHPIIGYLGTIQERIDLNLIAYLASNNPHSSIAMVGPVWQEKIKETFLKYKNVHFLGRKSYEEAPMYIQQFDVAIVPHKTDDFSKSTNPMKIFDYLACGKPVVSTISANLDIFGDLIYATNDYAEFNHYLSQALDEDKTINTEKRLNFIKEHGWNKRTDKMLELIYQKI